MISGFERLLSRIAVDRCSYRLAEYFQSTVRPKAVSTKSTSVRPVKFGQRPFRPQAQESMRRSTPIPNLSRWMWTWCLCQ